MTEDEAKAILSTAFNVSRETLEKINLYIEMLKKEMQNQNLISAASLDHIWVRHILDSAQLLHADIFPAEKANGLQSSGTGASWLDMGSGAGFPGIIIAIMSNWNVTLLESRTRRAAFLQSVIDALDLDASVACAKAETYEINSLLLARGRLRHCQNYYDWHPLFPQEKRNICCQKDVMLKMNCWKSGKNGPQR